VLVLYIFKISFVREYYMKSFVVMIFGRFSKCLSSFHK